MATRFSERVSAIQGIGTAYQETLSGVGVSYLRDLLSLEPERLHALEPALPLASLREWRSAAWLLTLDDMTPDMAECLVAAGIANVSQLADAGLQTLERALQKSVEKNEFKDPPSLYGLAALQRDAAKRAADTVITGFVLDGEDGKILEGASVRVGRHACPVGPDGSFLIAGVDAGANTLVIEADGYPALRLQVTTSSGRVCGPIRFELQKAADAPLRKSIHEHAGAELQVDGDSRIRLKMIGLSELPDDTWLRYQKDYADGQVKLVHIHRTRVGRDVFVERVKLPRADVPTEAALGSMLHWKDGALQASDKTRKQIALEHLQQFRPPFEITLTRTFVPPTRLERI